MNNPISRRLLAEFIGSLFLVFAAISPTILFFDILKSSITLVVLADALAVGFILFALIEAFGPISGCHINPAVTIAMMVSKDMQKKEGLLYIMAQIVGGLVGVMSSHLMFIHKMEKLIEISSVTRDGGSYVAEFWGTFLLVLVIFCCVRNRSNRTSLTVGLLVGGMVMTTSSTMFANPQVTIARVFTYAVAGISPVSALFFIGAQVLGGIVAAFTIRQLFQVSRAQRDT